MDRPDVFFDAARLLALRTVIRELGPDATPRARFLIGANDGEPSRLALLPGSYNPPTTAHVALADAVLRTGRVDRVDFLLASRTVDKERIEGATLPDRLLLLEELAASRPELGVVAVNRGLYVDQAEIVRAALPSLSDLWFAVGFDKIVQIFDPRYYQDRTASLDRLFSLAQFFVSPRGTSELDDLATLLNRPDNRQYAGRVTGLDLPEAFRQVSSSRLRARDPSAMSEVPDLVDRFIRETGAYDLQAGEPTHATTDRYQMREKALDLAHSNVLQINRSKDFRSAIDDLVASNASPSELAGASTRDCTGDVARAPADDQL